MGLCVRTPPAVVYHGIRGFLEGAHSSVAFGLNRTLVKKRTRSVAAVADKRADHSMAAQTAVAVYLLSHMEFSLVDGFDFHHDVSASEIKISQNIGR